MKAKMMQQSGMSEADMKAMKNQNKNMTPEEKRAMAMKMMQQSTGGGVEGNNDINANIAEQQELSKKLSMQESKYKDQLDELENDPAAKKILIKIDSLGSEWSKLGGVDYGQGPKMDAIAKQIDTEKTSYCNTYSPKYMSILKDYRTYIESSMSDYERLENLIDQSTKQTTGVDQTVSKPGLMGLEKIHDYVAQLQSIFKYNLLTETD
jgi:hypothetical protein